MNHEPAEQRIEQVHNTLMNTQNLSAQEWSLICRIVMQLEVLIQNWYRITLTEQNCIQYINKAEPEISDQLANITMNKLQNLFKNKHMNTWMCNIWSQTSIYAESTSDLCRSRITNYAAQKSWIMSNRVANFAETEIQKLRTRNYPNSMKLWSIQPQIERFWYVLWLYGVLR
jgi:hypothetical protein